MQLVVLTEDADDFLSMWEGITDKRVASIGAKGHRYSITTDDPATIQLIVTLVLNLSGCEATLRT